MKQNKNKLNLFFEECFYSILKHEQANIDSGGLSINEIHLISAISRNSDTKAANISKSLKITAGSLSVAANTLMAKGFITKKQDKNDKRIYRLHLTEKGKRINILHDEYHNDLIDSVIKGLEKEQFVALLAALEKIKGFTKIDED